MTDAHIEQAIVDLVDQRGAGKTICPSDAARHLYGDTDEGWRDLMEPVRQAAGRLAAAGRVQVTQGGRVVDVETVRGPIRIGRPD